jgi:hypothetical protein
MRNLNDRLTMLHTVLPPRTTLFLFYGHCRPRSMATLAAYQAEYKASQNQQQGKQSRSEAVTGSDGGTAH